MKTILCLLAVLLTTSCATSLQDQMNACLGLTKQELVLQKGPPVLKTDDGNGGEIYVYAKEIYMPASNYGVYLQAVHYWDYRFLYINKQGIIYHWLVKKEQIPPSQLNINLYVR